MEDYQSSVLERDNNFNLDDFAEIVVQNKGAEFRAIPQYRYILLQKRAVETEDYTETRENYERLFLQEFTDKAFKRLLKRMRDNGWTAKELLKEMIKAGGSTSGAESAVKYNN